MPSIIQFDDDAERVSINFPTKVKPYCPSFHLRRPGNIIFLAIILLIILILAVNVRGCEVKDPKRAIGCRLYSEMQFHEGKACLALIDCGNGQFDGVNCTEGDGIICGDTFHKSSTRPGPIRSSWLDEDLDSTICSIDDSRIKETCTNPFTQTREALVVVINGKHKTLIGDAHLTIDQPFKNSSYYDCIPSFAENCQGDDKFETHFLSDKRDGSCVCAWGGSKDELVYVTHNGETNLVDMVVKHSSKVVFDSESREWHNCEDCEIDCKEGRLILDVPSSVIFYELCRGEFCENLSSDEDQKIPKTLVSLGNTFHFRIILKDNSIFKGKITCQVEDQCQLMACTYCFEKLLNPHCFNLYDKIMIILTIASWFLLIAIIAKFFSLLSTIFKFILRMIKGLFWVVKGLFKIGLRITGRKLVKSKETIVKTVEEAEGTTRTITREEKKYTVVKKPFIKKSFIPLAMLSLSTLASSCSVSMDLKGESISCEQTKDNLICKRQDSVSISLSPVGQEVCLSVHLPDGRSQGMIKIRTNSIELACSKEVLFWTFDPRLDSHQSCWCRGTSECNEERCDKFHRDGRGVEPLPDSTNHVSEHGCKYADGGIMNSCFLTSDKCCYYHAMAVPKSEYAFEVFRCMSYYWRVPITVRFTNSNGTSTETGILNIANDVKFSFGTISLSAVSVPPMPILGDCFIRMVRGRTTVDKCPSAFSAGSFGDIRCPTQESARKGTRECRKAPGIFSAERRQGSLVIKANAYDLSQSRTKFLPLSSQGFRIETIDNTVQAKINSAGALKLIVKVDKLRVRSVTDKFKCSLKFIHLTGCANCLTGAELRAKIKVGIVNGQYRIKCPSLISDIVETSVSLESTVNLRAHFGLGNVNEECELICPDSNEKFMVTGKLISDIELPTQEFLTIWDYTEAAGKFAFSLFGDWGWLTGGFIMVLICGISIYIFLTLVLQKTLHSKTN